MNDPYRDHPSEDALERFLLNQSAEEELEIVETHFLACDTCVTRLEVMELQIAAAKLALQDAQSRQKKRLQSVPKRKSFASWFTLPQLSLAGGALAACALAITFVSIPRQVNLSAERGNESTSVAEWVPLHLHLDARDLHAGPVTVRLVDNKAGKQIWERAASVKNQEIDLNAPRLTSQGSFLVEVYAPAAGDPIGDLVREYSITSKAAF